MIFNYISVPLQRYNRCSKTKCCPDITTIVKNISRFD